MLNLHANFTFSCTKFSIVWAGAQLTCRS